MIMPSAQCPVQIQNVYMYIIVNLRTLVLGFMLLGAIVTISTILTNATASSASSSAYQSPQNTRVYPVDTKSSVQLSLPYGSGSDKKSLEYLHCGTKFTESSLMKKDLELILLHGAKFKKEDWSSSGVLADFCLKGKHHISVVAIDLSVTADGLGFQDAYEALVRGKVISGHPVVVISPSASGRAIVSMGRIAAGSGNYSILKSIIKVWIPVASPAVLSVRDDAALASFSLAGIPVFAINGDQDNMGKKVTKKLESTTHAKGGELNGGHAVYLDSPKLFVDIVMRFLSGNEDNSRY
jgi:vacuolar-type H+-ATPase subunit F/Vma7